jgi:hypothetical protein
MASFVRASETSGQQMSRAVDTAREYLLGGEQRQQPSREESDNAIAFLKNFHQEGSTQNLPKYVDSIEVLQRMAQESDERNAAAAAAAAEAPAAAAAAAAAAPPGKSAEYFDKAEEFMTALYPFINSECITILHGCCVRNIDSLHREVRNDNVLQAVISLYASIKEYLESVGKFKGLGFEDGTNYLEMEATFGIDVCTSWLHFFVNNDESFEIEYLKRPSMMRSLMERLETLHKTHKNMVETFMRTWRNSIRTQKNTQLDNGKFEKYRLGKIGVVPTTMKGTLLSKMLANMTAMARTILLTCESSSNDFAKRLNHSSPFIKVYFLKGLSPDCLQAEYYTTWAKDAYSKIQYLVIPEHYRTSGDMDAVWIASI